ncbi:MAG TPA: DNA polymerase Y family protein, partial [Stellaceae bacterium]|nr:DNA polymerase Y family protein [Stellaceae bacterium]
GMGVADARALDPALLIEETDFIADAAALTKLAAWCDRFSPWVTPCGTDGILLDVTGCAHLFGDEAGMASQVIARLARQGIAARGAIADTLGAAWALSRFGRGAAITVPPGNAQQALADLPVAALRLEPEIVALLERLGLQRIGELYPLPRAALAARCGDSVATRLDQALGHAAEPLSPVPPAPLLWSRRSCPEPIATAEAIAAALRELLQHLMRRLTEDGLGARRLSLAAYRVDSRIERIAIGTAFPSRDTRHLWRLFEEKLEKIDPGLGIEDLVLTAESVEKLAATQLGLDGEAARSDSADLAALVDRLANRLGMRALARPVLRESHIPERAVQFVAPLEGGQMAACWNPAQLRPIRLLSRPEPIEATAPIPDDPPLLFRWRQRAHRVRAADGPERIAAEWWRQDATAGSGPSAPELRDYYRVEDEEGQRFWLYRAGLYQPDIPVRWFLHGFFG